MRVRIASSTAGAPRFGSFAARSAATHASASADAGWLGSLRVSNEPAATWPEFYVERRLRPLIGLAREREALSAPALATLERVCERVPELAGAHEPPARLHGDLWTGNVLADVHGRPWLIDPAAYGGHREVDLAMLALFGAPAGALDAYREAAPLASGWRERVGLYQLLPLLVHVLLFGGSYRDSLARTAARYA